MRLRWLHLVPLLFLAACLISMYLLATKLASEIHGAQRQQQHGGAGDTDAASLDEVPMLSLPSSFEEARVLSLSLSRHLESHPSSHAILIALFACVYVLKQTFSIPGSGVLNVTAGFIFGLGFGLPLVAFLTALGASGCYWLSALVGRELIGDLSPPSPSTSSPPPPPSAASPDSVVPSTDAVATTDAAEAPSAPVRGGLAARVANLQRLVDGEKRRGSLFMYMLVLRVFPFTPNFFVNLASPLIGVPFHTFFVSCALGLVPYVYITVGAGDTLRVLSDAMAQTAGAGEVPKMSAADILDAATMCKLALLALALLLPMLLKRFVLNKGSADTSKEEHYKL